MHLEHGTPRPARPSLLRARRFLPLFVTQFLGAFNDNVFKNAMVVLIAFGTLRAGDTPPALVVNLCAAVFILPFFLFSAIAGRLADSADKAAIARATKLLEIAVMALGMIGFVNANLPLLLLALFLMGSQSTLFGPVKYALLPQHLHADELMRGNGWIEAGTFVAILLGTVGGGLLAAGGAGAALAIGSSCLLIAGAGYLASRSIPPAPPEPGTGVLRLGRPLADTVAILRLARTDAASWVALLAISWFWFFGATFLTLLPIYTREWLAGDETVVTLLLAVFAIGIGLGALLAARWCRGQPRALVVCTGAVGMSLFALDLWWATPAGTAASLETAAHFVARWDNMRILADCLLVSISGGLFSVPLYTCVQQRTALPQLGRMIAAINVMNALFMVGSAGFAATLILAGAGVPEIWLATAVLNAAMITWLGRRWRRLGAA